MDLHLNKDTLKHILALSSCVSKDETRYHLLNIYLQLVDGKVTATATDGHKMVQITISDTSIVEWIDSQPRKDFYLSQETVKLLKVLLKSTPRMMPVVVIPNNILKDANDSGNYKYPNVAQFIPRQETLNKLSTPIGFNYELLNDIGEAFALGKNKGLKFEFSDKNNPMLIRPNQLNQDAGIVDALAVLMPMRI